jgi:hypothetical protein
MVTLLFPIQEVPISNLGPETGYYELGFYVRFQVLKVACMKVKFTNTSKVLTAFIIRTP